MFGSDELTRKHQKIHAWLSEMFDKEDGIPNFVVNNETISCLHKLMLHNSEMNRIKELTVQDLTQMKKEYEFEAARIHECLESVGLPIYVLSSAGKASLKNLTELAGYLQIKDVSKSSFCLALASLKEDLSNTKSEIEEKQDSIDKLKKKLDNCTKKMTYVNEYYDKVDQHNFVDVPVLQKRQKDTLALRQKTTNYHNQIMEFEEEEKYIEEHKHLHHDTLIKLEQKLNEIKKDLHPLQGKFKTYKSLPPDINLAKVKIEEAKRQLNSLEKQLQTDIDALAL